MDNVPSPFQNLLSTPQHENPDSQLLQNAFQQRHLQEDNHVQQQQQQQQHPPPPQQMMPPSLATFGNPSGLHMMPSLATPKHIPSSYQPSYSSSNVGLSAAPQSLMQPQTPVSTFLPIPYGS